MRFVKTHSAVDLSLVGGPWSAQHMAVVRAYCAAGADRLRRGELAGPRWNAIDMDGGRIPAAELTRDRVTGRTIDQKNCNTTPRGDY
ncbi:hypothetical protein [Rhodococcus globerulus]|uniref:hypothetical protein n=1 Tax=Rhodococcus globerulus TaxID=33008 RepID=UPI000B87BB7C|nr:hypothetical protein [Rhodococcus globerulus]